LAQDVFVRNLAFNPTVMTAETKIPAREMRANVVREGMKRMIAFAAVGWMFSTFGKRYRARSYRIGKVQTNARNQDCCRSKSRIGYVESRWESSLCPYGVLSKFTWNLVLAQLKW
jgi:hypothetical protein